MTPASVLVVPTPPSWVAFAATHWPALLVDHANCEKKAASTALSLVFSYPEDRQLTGAMSRIAREELRHFEQVQSLMQTLDVAYLRQKPGRYAAALRTAVRRTDPGRKLDLLLVGALIEARSAERFRLLAPQLPSPVADLYVGLERSEARHYELYLNLARASAGAAYEAEMTDRLAVLAAREAELATAPDRNFRFHSGAPA